MYICLILFLIVIDQLSKIVAVNYLKGEKSLNIIDTFFQLSYVENTGAAFGSFYDKTFFLIIISSISIIILFFMIKFSKSHFEKYGLFLILSGAIGNLIDRVIHGYVIDFLDFDFFDFQIKLLDFSLNRWPVFNIADSYIFIGVIIIIISLYLDRNKTDLS